MKWPWVCFALLSAACTSPTHSIQRSVDDAMADPGPVSSQAVLDDIESAWGDVMAKRTQLPRGQRARYAYHAWKVGRREQARRALQMERVAYPQAARFLDALLAHLQREVGS